MADISPKTDTSTDADTEDKNLRFPSDQSQAIVTSDASDKSRDQKTLRRLAQNREAARKSRLRKKAYVQQLESSRMKLTQLEQELQRARQQGIFISSSGDQSQSMSGNGALAFDVEYARWLEEHNRRINELRGAVNSHAGDGELRIIVDGILAHYDEIFRIKGDAAKADVFHILSGMWKTPAERCFLWLGGFRSSEILKFYEYCTATYFFVLRRAQSASPIKIIASHHHLTITSENGFKAAVQTKNATLDGAWTFQIVSDWKEAFLLPLIKE
ncbi:bZIP transcription factor family protein [Actinidia rufa]|uniref:BZIP transcription factor family protein n=1 Tax=Actinidia rufa TaxID=165716 RepID=A0A7J0HC44_9ERIC|nr:bZIP transcription factor family protein [Actinidia rufa]